MSIKRLKKTILIEKVNLHQLFQLNLITFNIFLLHLEIFDLIQTRINQSVATMWTPVMNLDRKSLLKDDLNLITDKI